MRYFDHNATSPLCDVARAAWLEAVEKFPGNPASAHRLGARAERVLEEARENVAELLGAPAGNLIWTSGATEANNAVIHHLAHTADGEVWLSALEHPCVFAAADRWLAGRYRLIPALPSGRLDMEWLREGLRTSRPAAVAIMAANNETGVIQPWQDVLALCREHGVLFFCDAAQWLGKLPSRGLAACDFVTGCAHKFGGPPGVGFLKVPSRSFRPLLVGGPQEEGRRAGTVNVPGAIACATALRAREKGIAAETPARRAVVRDEFERRLTAAVPGLQILGQGLPRLWNTSALYMPPVDCRRRWVVRLDKLGFAVSSGSACASGREKPSHVLMAMGLSAEGDRMVRVSGGWETPRGDWDALAEAFTVVAREFGCRHDPDPVCAARHG